MEISQENLGDRSKSSIECGDIGLLAIRDTMILLSGKWKIQIIGCLILFGAMRFSDLKRRVEGIAAKMLSKELQELELNELVDRQVIQTKPVTVEYRLTAHGETLTDVIKELRAWGLSHRKFLFRKE